MTFEIYYLSDLGMTETAQIVLVCSFVLNTLGMPVIILYSLKKIKEILDPLINKSYSIISIQILKLLII